MARIRTIKPEFWTSEQVLECSPMARLLFIGIWNFCDDAGNHVASLRTIKANVLPGDDIDSTTIQGLLDELYANDLVDFYVVDNKRYLHVTGWHHQRIDRPTYKHPEYKKGENDEKSIEARRTLDTQSPPEGNEKEGNSKGKEEAAYNTSEERSATSPKENLPPANPENIPDEAPSRNVQVAVLLRSHGADPSTHPNSKGISAIVDLNATDEHILTALETVKTRRKEANDPQPVNAAYLVPIIADLQKPQAEKPDQKPRDEWYRTEVGIDRKARELGMFARAGESYNEFKDRMFQEIKRREREQQGATV